MATAFPPYEAEANGRTISFRYKKLYAPDHIYKFVQIAPPGFLILVLVARASKESGCGYCYSRSVLVSQLDAVLLSQCEKRYETA